MEFALSSDQKMMQDSVMRTLDRVCPLDRVKAAVQQKERARPRRVGQPCRTRRAGAPHSRSPWRAGSVAARCRAGFRSAGPLSGARALHGLVRDGAARADGSGQRGAADAMAAEAGFGRRSFAGVAISESVSGARDGAGVRRREAASSTASRCSCSIAQHADIFIVADRNRESASRRRQGRRPRAHRDSTAIDDTRQLGELRLHECRGRAVPQRRQ